MEPYLQDHPFVLHTDHANLRYMETRYDAIRTFDFMIDVLPGKDNVADHQTRMFAFLQQLDDMTDTLIDDDH